MVIGPSPIFSIGGGEHQGVPVPYKWIFGHGIVLCSHQLVCFVGRADIGPLRRAVLNSYLEFSIADIVEAIKGDSTQCFVVDICKENLHLEFVCIPLWVSHDGHLSHTDRWESQAASVD